MTKVTRTLPFVEDPCWDLAENCCTYHVFPGHGPDSRRVPARRPLHFFACPPLDETVRRARALVAAVLHLGRRRFRAGARRPPAGVAGPPAEVQDGQNRRLVQAVPTRVLRRRERANRLRARVARRVRGVVVPRRRAAGGVSPAAARTSSARTTRVRRTGSPCARRLRRAGSAERVAAEMTRRARRETKSARKRSWKECSMVRRSARSRRAPGYVAIAPRRSAPRRAFRVSGDRICRSSLLM